MHLSTLVSRLDDRLKTAEYAAVDASANGLQVGPEDKEVEHVAFAVDGAVETFNRAASHGADLLVVHHGISWGGIDRVTGIEYDRISALIEGDVALYASHLPLDGHPEFGNAAGLASRLELADREQWGDYKGVTIGHRGKLQTPLSHESLKNELTESVPVANPGVQVLDHGPDRIEDVAIVTGSGTDYIRDAADDGVDALITGEGKQFVYHEAQELGVSVFLGGHYATETIGVRTLASLVSGWGPETTFIEAPTGL